MLIILAAGSAAAETEAALSDAASTPAQPISLGRPAPPEEIVACNLGVSPDGAGLPDGSGDVMTGKDICLEQCLACHGDFADGLGN